MLNPTSSVTRSPVSYNSSSITQSLCPSGTVRSGASINDSTSSSVSTSGIFWVYRGMSTS